LFDILIPLVGIGLATCLIAYLVQISPLGEPFKGWIWWAVIAIGVLWALRIVLPLFGVSLT
jgi:hypothetical protein